MKDWSKECFLWSQVNLTENDPAECDMEVWKQYWKDSAIEGVIINCGGCTSYYHSKYPCMHEAETLGDQDYFGKWNQAAREAGLAVIARMDISCTTEEMIRQHPDWCCLDKDGNQIKSGDSYVACVNSGYYQSFIPKIFEEIIEKYSPDGFSDNNWAGTGMNMICYCDNCRERFRRECGSELPEKVDWEDPIYRKWVKWGYSVRVKNWKHFNKVTAEAGGNHCRWFGMLIANPFGLGPRFYDLKALISDSDFLFCDHQARDSENGFEHNALAGSLIRFAGEENMLAAGSMSHYYRGLQTFRQSASTRHETRKWIECGAAGGFAPWFHVIGGNTDDQRRLKLSADLYRWIKENKWYFMNRTDTADIGVIWSQETAVYYGRNELASKSEACFQGITEVLSREGIPFLPIHADDIRKYENRLKLLILPNIAILTDEQEKAVTDWLKAGKNLIITDDTGLYDSEGEWKGPGAIYQLLGITVSETVNGQIARKNPAFCDAANHTYLSINDAAHPLFRDLEDTNILPFGGTVRSVASNGPLRPLSTFIPAFPVCGPEAAYIRERSDIGTIYAGELSSGSRVVYLPADLDRSYGILRLPDLKRVLSNAIYWCNEDGIPVRVSAPAHVSCKSYTKEGKLLIQLVNLAGCDGPLGTAENNLPIGPVRIIVKNLTNIRSCIGLCSTQPIESFTNNEYTEMIIPVLDEQEFVVIEADPL